MAAIEVTSPHLFSADSQVIRGPLCGMMRTLSFLALALALLVACATVRGEPPLPADLDIYETTISWISPRSPNGVLLEAKTDFPEKASDDLYETLYSLATRSLAPYESLNVSRDTVDQFEANQASPARLDGLVRNRRNIQLIEVGRWSTRFAPEPNGDRSRYLFSRPAISKDGRSAILYVRELCGPLCGGGFYLIFQRSGMTWTVDQVLLAWIS
jgi:hypothetical protein